MGKLTHRAPARSIFFDCFNLQDDVNVIVEESRLTF